MTRLIAVISMLVLSLPVLAEQSITCRDHNIHYTTFASTLIPPEVAAANGIVRAENRIIANITVTRDDRSVPAKVEGTVTNLLNQRVDLDFRKVTEQEAVYYLASHVVNETETLRFNMEIRPDGAAKSCQLEFVRRWN